MTTERNQRKVYQGRVVSDKMDKTITVLVETRKTHPKYGNALNILRNIKHMMKKTVQKKATSCALWKLVHYQLRNASVY